MFVTTDAGEFIVEDLGPRFCRVFRADDPRPLFPASSPPLQAHTHWGAESWAKWESATSAAEQRYHDWHSRARVYDAFNMVDRAELKRLGIMA